jgi:DNA-binding FrmR family transcriptional regulator
MYIVGENMVINDPECRTSIVARLNRAEGQIRGIRNMVEEGRSCVDILRQIAAVDGALRSTARVIIERHLDKCFAKANLTETETQRVSRELADIFAKFSNF